MECNYVCMDRVSYKCKRTLHSSYGCDTNFRSSGSSNRLRETKFGSQLSPFYAYQLWCLLGTSRFSLSCERTCKVFLIVTNALTIHGPCVPFAPWFYSAGCSSVPWLQELHPNTASLRGGKNEWH